MKTLVLGGVKSGKSRFADSLANDVDLPVTYLATATSDDEEMRLRIEHHKASRPSHWSVVEEPLALGQQIHALRIGQHCVLIDCLTLWLTNCLLDQNPRRFVQERQALIEAIGACQNPLIMVSNETNLGVTPMGALSRRFCDEAGMLHQEIASLCDTVIVTMAGLPLYLKGTAATPDR